MSTPVDAERAWQDLQRIRVPQERVYDEIERSAQSDPGSTYFTAAVMWVFLAVTGTNLPTWAFWLVLTAYCAVLGTVAVIYNRRSRIRLHRSRHSWRSFATFFAGMAVTLVTILVSGFVANQLALPFGSLIQATASAGAFALFVGPANRWAVSALRARGARAGHQGVG
ncbi:hypothetical protein BX264_2718 [Streptomyces sp. 2333.5]|uniref:hypothetical protein n=1 Tax=unclassified Streptomyces TaxID=2593676 RepID=UPI00089727C9|nr:MULTISPECIES: hypothetical protein [unclassified Streptomyces]PJJ02376.1 hypothetical protein BX264_2718 [Streptomyces sp. 2333.5]SED07260.1 hypothetical protein SAMN05428943_2856 [Streptomyces sp. 2314.4]SED94116.1 hypothetical protein SAMN05428942_2821 [Streptomyces sp. 2112.2]SOE13271.1 hypothetical protein SAMN06272775_4256 [Streptomyces sp. 2323.1]